MFDRDVLDFHPWLDPDGDGIRVVADRFVVTRKHHACVHCENDIAPGCRVRARSEAALRDLSGPFPEDGKVRTYYFCGACCDLMKAGDRDGYAARYHPGYPMSATSAGGPK